MPTLLYDQTFLAPGAPSGPTTEQTIDSIGGPTWVELAGIPFNTFGAGSLQIVVTLDAHYTVSGDNEVDAYVAAPGLSAPAFAGANIADVSNPSVLSSYSTLSLSPGTDTFTGPGMATSVYVWCPVVPPSFIGTTMKVKNVRVQIYSLTPPPPAAAVDSPTAGTMSGSDPIVFEGTAAAGLEELAAVVTDALGVPTSAYSLDGGFINGFTGTAVAITNGMRVTLEPLNGAWHPGPLHIDVTATDVDAATAEVTRDWTAEPEVIGNDYRAQAASRVIQQYKASAKLLAWIDYKAQLAQQIDNALQTIPTLDDPSIATGVNLDVTGQLVGQPRRLGNGDVATDGEYNVIIGARVTRNHARVSSEDYLAALVAFFGVPVQLTDFGGMSISYVVFREPTSDEIAVLDEDIVARPMGVTVSRLWAPSTGYWGFAEDPNALGFADDSGGYPGTGGGVLSVDF